MTASRPARHAAVAILLGLGISAGSVRADAPDACQDRAPVCAPGAPGSPDGDSLNVRLVGRAAMGQDYAVCVRDSLVYTGGGSCLLIFSIADPGHPSLLGLVRVHDMIQGIRLAGNFAFLACDRGGFRIVDVTNPRAPVEAGSLVVPGNPVRVWLAGDVAYLACGDSGLVVVDVADPRAPVAIGRCPLAAPARDVLVAGDVAYVAVDRQGLRVVDVSVRTSPQVVGSVPGDSCSTQKLFLADTLLYVADRFRGLMIYCVADPLRPEEVGSYPTRDWAEGIWVRDSLAYVACDLGGLWVINVADPACPALVGTFMEREYGRRAFDLEVAGNVAYVANLCDGLWAIDVSDPRRPFATCWYDTGSASMDVAAANGYLFIASA